MCDLELITLNLNEFSPRRKRALILADSDSDDSSTGFCRLNCIDSILGAAASASQMPTPFEINKLSAAMVSL